VWIGLLGPLELRTDDGSPVELPGVRLRTLLARLAIAAEHPVTADALIDAVWADTPPAGAANALQSLVSRLRRFLRAPARLEVMAAGYRLTGVTVDIGEFERLVAARDQDDGAAGRYAEALALWRGVALADVPTVAPGLAAQLEERRLTTAENLAELRLDAAELAVLVATHPTRERTRALHMRALVAAGRPADALASYAELRRHLAESLGVDPSPALRDLHAAILRGEPGRSESEVRRQTPPRADRRPGNVRAALTSFVGREAELARLDRAVADGRLVTVVGPGGAGKTRLVAEFARRHRCPDGVWLVELAGLVEAGEVPAAILSTLGRREGGLLTADGPDLGEAAPGPIERVVTALRERDLVLVLDNCEHLLDACAAVAEAVLGGCPGVRILVTTREPLGLTGEALCPLGPLPVPPTTVDAETALANPAVRLFVDRARAGRPDFAVTADNVADVAEVCRRLDGLPLAIELACARLRTLPLAEVAARLGDRFRLLTGGSRTALPRHQTLQAVIGWSWDLFSTAEQRLATRLAVFSGGATVAAVEAVGGDSTVDAIVLLGALVEKSFVQLEEQPDGTARYAMLDSVRAFAVGRLAEAGDADRVRDAHARHFLGEAEAVEPTLRTGAQLTGLARLEREYDNLTAALRWAVDSGDAATAVRLVSALGWYWLLRGGRSEPLAWLDEALDLPGADEKVPAATLVVAHAYRAVHRFSRRDLDGARESGSRSHELTSAAPPDHPIAVFVDAIMRCPETGISSVLNGLAELDRHDDPWVRAAGTLIRGHAAESAGDATTAIGRYRAARAAFTAVGDRWGRMMALNALTNGLSLDGDHAAAIDALTEAAALALAVGAEDDAVWSRGRRGVERLRAGEADAAAADLADAHADAVARRSPVLLALIESGLADAARHRGDLDAARAWAGAALERVAGGDGALHPRLRGLAMVALAWTDLAAGDAAAAEAGLARALAELGSGGDPRAVAEVAEALAAVAVATGDPADAARWLGLAVAVRGTADKGSPDVRATELSARTALGDAGFDQAYRAAAALGPAEAHTRLLAGQPERRR
jgi:predicted ATPase/DNA-binding SARP family transcriptional activator